MHIPGRVVLLAVAASLTSACHGCNRGAGSTPVSKSLSGHDAWEVRMGEGGTVPTAAVVGGKIIVGNGFSQTSLVALDSRTGRTLWTTSLGDNGAGPAAAEGDAVAFTTESCTLYVSDAQSGSIRWSKWLGDPLVSHPAVDAHVVYLVAPEQPTAMTHALFAFDAANGTERWHSPVGADAIGSPAVAGDRIYVTTQDGLLRRFTLEGQEVWTVAAGAMSAPVADGGQLFVVARERMGEVVGEGIRRIQDGQGGPSLSKLWHARGVANPPQAEADPIAGQRFDAAERHLGTSQSEALWSWQGGHPTIADGRLFALLGDDLVAVDTANGQQLWAMSIAGIERPVAAPPVVHGKQLFLVTSAGALEIRDVTTGAIRESLPIGAAASFPPVIDGDRVVVSTKDGRVISINAVR